MLLKELCLLVANEGIVETGKDCVSKLSGMLVECVGFRLGKDCTVVMARERERERKR